MDKGKYASVLGLGVAVLAAGGLILFAFFFSPTPGYVAQAAGTPCDGLYDRCMKHPRGNVQICTSYWKRCVQRACPEVPVKAGQTTKCSQAPDCQTYCTEAATSQQGKISCCQGGPKLGPHKPNPCKDKVDGKCNPKKPSNTPPKKPPGGGKKPPAGAKKPEKPPGGGDQKPPQLPMPKGGGAPPPPPPPPPSSSPQNQNDCSRLTGEAKIVCEGGTAFLGDVTDTTDRTDETEEETGLEKATRTTVDFMRGVVGDDVTNLFSGLFLGDEVEETYIPDSGARGAVLPPPEPVGGLGSNNTFSANPPSSGRSAPGSSLGSVITNTIEAIRGFLDTWF